MDDDASDGELIFWALSIWANYIETDNVVLSAEDAQTQGAKLNALNLGQMKRVVRLRELAAKHLKQS